MNFDHRNRICVLDVEASSYHPWDGRLICIGVKDAHTGEAREFFDDNEEAMLVAFLQYFNGKKFDEIVGYNLLHDSRFIFGKCLKYRIPADGFFSAIRTDIMMTLKGGSYLDNYNRPGRLSEWGRFLFNREKPPESESIRSLYRQRRIDEIVRCNRDHVEMTYEVWKRIRLVLRDAPSSGNCVGRIA